MKSTTPRSLRRLALGALTGLALAAAPSAALAVAPTTTWFSQYNVNLPDGSNDTSGWSYVAGGNVAPDGSAYAWTYFGGTSSASGIQFGSLAPVSDPGGTSLTKSNPDGSFAWSIPVVMNWGGQSAARDGGIYQVGTGVSASYYIGATPLQVGTVLVKVAGDGTVAWQSGPAGAPSPLGFVNGVGAAPDGGAFIAGFNQPGATLVYGPSTLPAVAQDTSYVAKANADGTWAWALQASGKQSYGNAIQAYPDGSALMSGSYDSRSGPVEFGTASITSPGEGTFFAKANADGTWAWVAHAVNDKPCCWGYRTPNRQLTIAADGSAYVVDTFTGTATFGSTTLTSRSGATEMFVAKLNPDGTWAWATRLGDSGTTWATSATATMRNACGKNDGAVVTGGFTGAITLGDTTLTSPNGNDSGFAAQIGPDGTWQWAMKMSNATAGSGTYSNMAAGVPNGGVILWGRSGHAPYAFGDANVTGKTGWWTKLDLGQECPTPTPAPPATPTAPAQNQQTPSEASPAITMPAASVTRGATLTTAVNPSVAGTVRVTATLRGRTVCTATRKATRAGRMMVTCTLRPAARAAIRKKAVTLRVTTRLTDAAGKTATASRNVRVARYVVRVPVTG